jgi:PAS domain S-box-containing protein
MHRLLVVEDSPTQAAALEELLVSEGFEVQLARNGQEASQILDSATFDAIITDVIMPTLSGHELCRKIKDDPKKSRHPVILLTQMKSPMDIVQGLECGADNFITKPYDPAYLVGRIRDLLESSAQTPQMKLRIEADVLFLGKHFTINADKAQIVDLLFATFEEMVRTNQELQTSQDRLTAAKAQVEKYAKQLKKKARTSEEKYKRLMEQANDGIFLLDSSGVVLEVNRRGEEVLGRASADIIGRPFEAFVPNVKVEPERGQLQALHGAGSTSVDHVSFKCPDGRTVWINLSISRVEIGSDRMILTIVHDITERKILEERYQQAQKLDAIGQLAGGVAHDFNNLLTVIGGYSEVVLTELPPESALRAHVGEIRKAAERAAGLTRQLLLFSRKQVLEPRVLNLNAIVIDTQKMLGRLIGEDISLTTKLDPNLGPVLADAGQMEQIIMNLALNARDAMPQGGKITIETANVELDEIYARMHPEAPPGRYSLLAVSDTGCGISDDVKAHLFEPFFTTKAPNHGTGLGLATVYGIVKQCRGHIGLYSEPNQGATFKIYLPRLDETMATGKVKERLADPPHGRETVLVVEDGDAVRAITRQMLQMAGYRVLEASDGAEATRLVEAFAEPIHLLVTDVIMPHMGGRQLAGHLVKLRPELKVLFFSGYMDDAIVRHGILQAEVAFLHKPFTLTALANKVREVLDGTSHGFGGTAP